MLIGILQSLAFVFTALLLTIWRDFVSDHGKFKFGMWCLIASVAVAGLTTEWIGYALAAILFSLSMLFTFESLLTGDQNKTDET